MTSSEHRAHTRIFTRDFCLLFATNLIVTSVYFLLMTTMAYYAVQAYGVGDATAGLTASIFLVGGVLGRIACARWCARFGNKALALASLILQLIACALYFATGLGIVFLIGLRLVHGFAFGIANTVVPAMAVETFPKERMGEGTGYFMLSNSLGVGVGPLMSVLVAVGLDYTVLFVISTVLAVVCLICTLLVHTRGKANYSTAGETCPPRARGLRSILDLSTVKLSVFMFLVAFSYSSLNSFLNSYANELDMAVFGPFVFLIYSVVLLISRPITGKLMDRFGENAVLYPSIFSMAVGLALAANVQNPAMLLCCGIFMATGFGTCMSTGQAAAIKMTRGSTALAISTFFLLCDAGCGLGPFFLGFIVAAAGYRVMFWQCCVIALIALVYYHFAHGRKVATK